ncbi:hypothetical protein [Streptomyces sp. NPDC047108]|uniref:hypothetical protein n=1 Tax=Streptomyces sp. NPDC047108 TaxID=3155025 RepID=UPI0033E95D97
MGSVEDHQGWSSATFSCRACKRPVQAVARKRRKVFGTYVPVWEPGPCENPECSRHAGPPPQSPDEAEAAGAEPAGRTEDGPADGPKETEPGQGPVGSPG